MVVVALVWVVDVALVWVVDVVVVWVVVFWLTAVTGVAPLGGAAGLVVAWQSAVTLWTGGVPGGSMSMGGVPGGALTVKVRVVPSRRVAVTVH